MFLNHFMLQEPKQTTELLDELLKSRGWKSFAKRIESCIDRGRVEVRPGFELAEYVFLTEELVSQGALSLCDFVRTT